MDLDNRVYVTGHRNPDTDSVASAIAYSFFKRSKGIPAVPCRLGKLSAETKYLLNRFGFEEPVLLEDARKKLSEIELDKPIAVHQGATIQETVELMKKYNQTYIGVLDDEDNFVGIVAKSDFVDIGLDDTAHGIELLKHTSASYMAKTIAGTLVYEAEKPHINGKVSIIAITKSKLENYEIKDRIVILGDDPESQKQLIEKGAGVIIAVWAKEIREDVIEMAREYNCSLIISGHGSMNTSRYIYFAPPVELVMKRKFVFFYEDEYVEDTGKRMLEYRFRGFPVLTKDHKLVGYVSRYHVLRFKNKKIIMVDHNEFSQSVKSIEKAQILEVLDHHRIYDFASNQPVEFRNEIVGSTATIISKIFRENQIPIPPNYAGLLLGALLSDTLMFASPTTTPLDKETANILAAAANLDIDTFGRELFSASRDSDMSLSEQISQDVKFYDIHGYKVMISQLIVAESESYVGKEFEILDVIENICKKKDLDIFVLAITGIMEKGSRFYLAGEKAHWVREVYPDKEGENHSLQEGILSRKKQIVPTVTEAVSKYA